MTVLFWLQQELGCDLVEMLRSLTLCYLFHVLIWEGVSRSPSSREHLRNKPGNELIVT